MKHLNEKAAQNLTAIREQKPLIHNITNFVNQGLLLSKGG